MKRSYNQMSPAERREYEPFLDLCRRLKEGIPPVPSESPGKKDKRIKHLLDPRNFEDFIDFYFRSPDFEPAPLGWFHWDFIDNFFIKKERKNVLEVFRESAKSVLLDIFTPIHMLGSGDLKGMILASENQDKAKNLIKDVEAQLRSNKRIISDYGDQGIIGSWMQGFFQTKNGQGFWAFGLGQNPAGVRDGFQRPNLGIIDDADSFAKSKNPKWPLEISEWINGEFMGCLSKDDRRFAYANNRVHKSGLTAHMVGDVNEDDTPDPNIAHVKAYLTEDPVTHAPIYPEGKSRDEIKASLIKQGAVPAWDEYYSLDDAVDKIVDGGITSSLRQHYHKHIITGTIFDDDNMPWIDPLPLHLYDAIVDYCDPAFGESGKGSYKAIIRVGKKGHTYDVLKVWLRQIGEWWNLQYDWHQEISQGVKLTPHSRAGFNMKVRNYQSWVECNELQKTELRKTYQLANLSRDTAWFPRYDNDHKGDKIGRIESALEPIMNEGMVRFSNQLRKDRDMIELRDQFKSFPNGFIDGPDAVHGAKTKLDRMVRSHNTDSRGGKFKRDKKKVG